MTAAYRLLAAKLMEGRGRMLFAIVVAVAVPLTFLFMVRWLDLYASGNIRTGVVCLLWGIVAFFLAFQANTIG